MIWQRSHRADRRALPLADRHYNRQKPGTPQFVPPGRCLVLLTPDADALWISSWPFAEYVKHRWAGAWVCSCFRNESPLLASDLIVQATAATLAEWGSPSIVPARTASGSVSFVTFIDRKYVRPTMVRGRPVWGWTWIKAGWEPIGETKGGLLVLGLRRSRMPQPEPADEWLPLFDGAAV